MWRSYRRKGIHEELQDDGGEKYEDLKEDFLSDASQDDHALEDSFNSQFKHEIHVNPSIKNWRCSHDVTEIVI